MVELRYLSFVGVITHWALILSCCVIWLNLISWIVINGWGPSTKMEWWVKLNRWVSTSREIHRWETWSVPWMHRNRFLSHPYLHLLFAQCKILILRELRIPSGLRAMYDRAQQMPLYLPSFIPILFVATGLCHCTLNVSVPVLLFESLIKIVFFLQLVDDLFPYRHFLLLYLKTKIILIYSIFYFKKHI